MRVAAPGTNWIAAFHGGRMNDSRAPEPSSWRAWALVMLCAAVLSGPLLPKLMDRMDPRPPAENAAASGFVAPPASPVDAEPKTAPAASPSSSPAVQNAAPDPAPVVADPPSIVIEKPVVVASPRVVATGDALPAQMLRPLTGADLAGKTRWELDLLRNEIYARHHRRFARADLQRYFDAQSWYSGLYSPEQFTDAMLTPLERSNAEMIRQYEASVP
jgi:hypothetical protein